MNISGEIPFKPLNYFSESDNLLLQDEDNAHNELSWSFNENECFIVYWNCLSKLFKICRSCT